MRHSDTNIADEDVYASLTCKAMPNIFTCQSVCRAFTYDGIFFNVRSTAFVNLSLSPN